MAESGEGAIAWMARNRVTANLLMIVLVIGGFFSSLQIRKEVFPDFQLDQITVTVGYPGGTPTDVEQGIVLAIEEAVIGISGIDEVNSTASEGSALVTLELSEGEDRNAIFQDVQQAVSRITTFPEDAERPDVSLLDRQRGVVTVLLFGETREQVLREIAETVRDQMLSSAGITQVELEGARDYRIHVEVPQSRLQAHGLDLRQIAERVSSGAVDVSGGRLDTPAGEVLIRVSERRDWAREFAELPIINNSSGSVVKLGEIATVKEGFDETQTRSATFNGLPAIGLQVFRIGDQTPTGVSKAAHAAVEAIRADLPEGVDMTVLNDRSEIYQQRLELLMKNAFIGLLVVFVLLSVFLEFKLAFWVTMGIPISFLGAMLFLPSFGASINMVSMFAFIISLGIVVDDAIIAGENIYEYRQRGLGFIEAAVQGARDIAMPVTFSVLTNIVAFLPLLFVPGFVGKIWKVIPLVVCTVFALSLIEALFILPSHLAHSKPLERQSWIRRRQQQFSDGFSAWVHRRYQPLVEIAVAHRYLTVSIGVGLLMVILSYALSGRMGLELFPSIESDVSQARAFLPLGTPPEEILAVGETLRRSAQAVVDQHGGDELSEGIYIEIQQNRVRAELFLTESSRRPISTSEVTRLWRDATPALANVQSIRFASDAHGPGGGPSLTVELSHRDTEVLDQASRKLAESFEEFPNVSGMDDGFQPGKKQFDVKLLDAGRSLGLSARDIAAQIRAAFFGAEVLRQQRGRSEVRVMVRLPESERGEIGDIDALLIRTPAGTWVPLASVAEVEAGRAFDSITRRAGRRTVQVTGDVTPKSASNQVLATAQADILPSLLREYPGLTFSLEGRQADLREAMRALTWGFVVVLGLIYLLLAIPFGSYIQPAIVMCAIPFGMFGAIIGHLLMGYPISIISMMGVVALSGVVVNDSLVMVHYANERRAQGESSTAAIVQAGARRFRPILLTTLSTFGGLAPMIFETSRQARFLIPMAISLGYGILFATAITLLIVPCLYLIIEDLRDFLGGRRTRLATEQGARAT